MNRTGRMQKGTVAMATAFATVVVVASAQIAGPATAGPPPPRAPERLGETGLYADPARKVVRTENLPYEPQYPLWSDGAVKRRWIYLPPGTTIDASDPDQWRFPIGTKFWKEFQFGRAVETRYMELAGNGDWIYATYVWSEDGSDAVLAPARGIPGAVEIRSGVRHDIPGYYDCIACHEGQPSRVLGFSALQLSPDRDPLALHAVTPAPDAIDLDGLNRRGLIRGLPDEFVGRPPRIEAPTARARAVLGYLHGNCGTCHNPRGPLADLGLSLIVTLSEPDGTHDGVLPTTVGHASRFRPPGRCEDSDCLRIAPGDPAKSVLLDRIRSRAASVQMPPLGTHIADDEAIALITSWIHDDLRPQGVALIRPSNPSR
jgi:hypothetical protein